MSRAPLQAVVFDLDDTLYPERDYILSGYRAVGAHLQERLHREDDFDGWLRQRFLAGESAGALDAMNAHFSLGLGREQIAELVEFYRRHVPTITPLPEMVELLGQLHGRYKLAILSDGYLPAQRLKLQALGVGRFFEQVLFTEELGREAWKPSSQGFEWIAGKLGTPHAACVYVADNLAKDFIAPNRLGWRTVRYVFEGQVHHKAAAEPIAQPQHVAHNSGEILAALAL